MFIFWPWMPSTLVGRYLQKKQQGRGGDKEVSQSCSTWYVTPSQQTSPCRARSVQSEQRKPYPGQLPGKARPLLSGKDMKICSVLWYNGGALTRQVQGPRWSAAC